MRTGGHGAGEQGAGEQGAGEQGAGEQEAGDPPAPRYLLVDLGANHVGPRVAVLLPELRLVQPLLLGQ